MASLKTRSHAAVRLPRAERRAQIVDAAAGVFLQGGYEKTSMEDVARAAGVTRLIVYRIFETKDALYLAVLTAVLDDLAARFEPGPPPPADLEALDAVTGGDVPDHGRSIAGNLLAVARRHPDGFRLLWRHASHQTEFHDLVTLFRAVAADYAGAIIAEMRADPLVVRWAAGALVSQVHESICLWLDDGDASLDDQFLRMLADGLRATVTAWLSGPRP